MISLSMCTLVTLASVQLSISEPVPGIKLRNESGRQLVVYKCPPEALSNDAKQKIKKSVAKRN